MTITVHYYQQNVNICQYVNELIQNPPLKTVFVYNRDFSFDYSLLKLSQEISSTYKQSDLQRVFASNIILSDYTQFQRAILNKNVNVQQISQIIAIDPSEHAFKLFTLTKIQTDIFTPRIYNYFQIYQYRIVVHQYVNQSTFKCIKLQKQIEDNDYSQLFELIHQQEEKMLRPVIIFPNDLFLIEYVQKVHGFSQNNVNLVGTSIKSKYFSCSRDRDLILNEPVPLIIWRPTLKVMRQIGEQKHFIQQAVYIQTDSSLQQEQYNELQTTKKLQVENVHNVAPSKQYVPKERRVIMCDNREFQSLVPLQLSDYCNLQIRTLQIADYLLNDEFAIERKERSDLRSSIQSRLCVQLERQELNYQKNILLCGIDSVEPEQLEYLIGCMLLFPKLLVIQVHYNQQANMILRFRELEDNDQFSANNQLIGNDFLLQFLNNIPFVKSANKQKLLQKFVSIYELVNAEVEELVDLVGVTGAKLWELINFK
ncbi:DNA_repair protein (Rad1) domain-containing protein [Hexamita inflata]|uniref:DNA repair protein (Rad1) domain-containing protein n=1 Tax=Hexamita inflata TaxID=28002 RepID=A0AA86P088_9EUKA|nr:DNA repair protein (Rad1) domain-containing protein [Hexamita inflata]